MAFLIPSSLLISPGSSLFNSIFISQASLPSLLEEKDNMMPGLDNSGRKQLETKTKDICVVRWSKPSRDYIIIFYRPKEVSCKKTESGEHTRCPRGRGRAQGVGRALHPCGRLMSFLDYFLFSYFLKYSKTEENCN